MSKTAVIIPCRMGSTRLPGKPMKVIGGLPLVHWTYNQAKRAIADYVIVTSPDREVGQYCRDNGLTWFPTSNDPSTGTHRCAELLEHFRPGNGIDRIVCWQVDEPLVSPLDVNKLLIRIPINSTHHHIHTLVSMPTKDIKEYDYNTIKAAVSKNGRAHWFSRAPMKGSLLHCGIYAYRLETLMELGRKTPTMLSNAESLEQLAWIENDFEVWTVSIGNFLPLSINIEKDLIKFQKLVEEEKFCAN